MIAVLILIVIFGGIALITYVDNTTKAQRRAWRLEDAAAKAGQALPSAAAKAVAALPHAAAAPAPEGPETLILRLPDDARARAWALLCTVADAQQGKGNPDTRTAYLLRQTRESYLPDTLRAWLLHQGRRDDVAAALFVHPQTVRYRMGQLRDLYGDSLEDPDTVLELLVALA